jgi:hypothetical protein
VAWRFDPREPWRIGYRTIDGRLWAKELDRRSKAAGFASPEEEAKAELEAWRVGRVWRRVPSGRRKKWTSPDTPTYRELKESRRNRPEKDRLLAMDGSRVSFRYKADEMGMALSQIDAAVNRFLRSRGLQAPLRRDRKLELLRSVQLGKDDPIALARIPNLYREVVDRLTKDPNDVGEQVSGGLCFKSTEDQVGRLLGYLGVPENGRPSSGWLEDLCPDR